MLQKLEAVPYNVAKLRACKPLCVEMDLYTMARDATRITMA